MMTESEFKVHMSAYLQRLTMPMKHQIKQIEQRLNRLEKIISGDISPAFPYTDKNNISDNTNEDNLSSAKSDEEDASIIESYLKLIYEDVSMIKDFIGEYKQPYY